MAFFKVLTRALLLGIVLTLTILSDSPAVLDEQESQPGLPFVKKLQDTFWMTHSTNGSQTNREQVEEFYLWLINDLLSVIKSNLKKAP